MAEVKVILVIQDKEIVNVLPYDGSVVSPQSPEHRKKCKHSAYGLRPVETIYETPDPDDALMTKCFMVIGGFKVQVPC